MNIKLLIILSICLICFGFSSPQINLDSEEKVYIFLSRLPRSCETEFFIKRIITIDDLPILFKFLENSEFQNNWIERSELEGKENKPTASRAGMLARALRTIPILSKDEEIMNRLYRFIKELLTTGQGRQDVTTISDGIRALSKDTSLSTQRKLIQLSQELVQGKYPLENLVDPIAQLTTPLQIREHFLDLIDERIQFMQDKIKENKPVEKE